jgi:hypothetical protein
MAPKAEIPEQAVPVLIAKFGGAPFIAVWTPRWGWINENYFADGYRDFRSDVEREFAHAERGFEPDVFMHIPAVPAAPAV